MREVTIFNKVNSEGFNYTGSQIARWSGLDTGLISRFLNGKTDISVSRFFKLIRSMPENFQRAYWLEMLNIEPEDLPSPTQLPWDLLISQASHSDMEQILQAITLRWSKLGQEKELIQV